MVLLQILQDLLFPGQKAVPGRGIRDAGRGIQAAVVQIVPAVVQAAVAPAAGDDDIRLEFQHEGIQVLHARRRGQIRDVILGQRACENLPVVGILIGIDHPVEVEKQKNAREAGMPAAAFLDPTPDLMLSLQTVHDDHMRLHYK